MSNWRDRVEDVRDDEQALFMAMAHELDMLEADMKFYRVVSIMATIGFLFSTYIS